MTTSVFENHAEPGARDARRALADDLIDELTGWSPPERLLTLRGWHRGAYSLIHLIVLTVLETEGPLSMRRIAEALDVSDASATGIVDRIERRGLVERRHGAGDRRVVLVHLTERGAAVFREIKQRRRARLSLLVAELSDDDLAGLLAGLRAMRSAAMRVCEELATPRAGAAV